VTTIVMNDFKCEPEALVQAQVQACERVLRSGWWILGEEVAAFEKEWAARLGIAHAIGCGNGLDAIEIGLRVLGIGPGDEVITTPMTAFATVLAVLRAGATPVLADIEPDTAMLSPQSVRRCISARTKAVLLVHLYGQIGAVEELGALAKDGGFHLIEDCAQAHGAELYGRPAGSFGILAAWSFYPTKNLGAVGDGGALTTSQPELADTARSLRNYGQTVRYHHPLLGMNSRLDELQAAILRERLPFLSQWTNRRREVARMYAVGIRHPHVRVLPLPEDPNRHVHHLFVVTCAERENLQHHLKENEIQSLIHYPIPVHMQPPCRDLRRDPTGLRIAEEHAGTCLSLPCHPGLTDQMVQRVIEAVNRFREG
jgi:dTDP-4-amino-4,6-dideoxygalactose transaminase